MMRSEQLEREAERTRSQLTDTVNELRTRITPGQVVDQLVDFSTDSTAAEFLRNLRDKTVANPLALGMLGAGMAWLMFSDRRKTDRQYEVSGEVASSISDAARSAGSAAAEAAGAARDRITGAATRASEAPGSVGATAGTAARSARARADAAARSIRTTAGTARDATVAAASRWREAAGSAASSVGDAASSTYEQAKSRMSETTSALGDAASTVYGGVTQSANRTATEMKAFAKSAATASQNIFDFCREQPLVLAGLGIALGAAIGAALPPTEAENRLMGEASDEVKKQARALAQEQYEKTKSSTEAMLDEAQHKAEESARSLSDQPSIIPSASEGEVRRQEPLRPEPTGSHGHG